METTKNNLRNIVIADDDLDDHYIIKDAIEKIASDSTFISVYNGLELMNLLNGTGKFEEQGKVIPELIIMDLNMPLLDGLGALAKIKEANDLKEIPVYILSTSRFDYDKQKAMEAGANNFYSKPYKFEELKEIIKEIYNTTFSTL